MDRNEVNNSVLSASLKFCDDDKTNERNNERSKILVVDDRHENLVAVRKVLKPINADILEADCGNKALSLMLRHEFAVVLLDVQMPDMDGFEVASLMRGYESISSTPIVFLTAISKDDCFVDQAAELNAVDYVFKPINPNILRSKIKVYVELYEQKKSLKRLNESLIKKNKELEIFAYICSHDLQEPVRSIMSFSSLLASDYKDVLDDQGNKILDVIQRNAANMHKMINDIFIFCRVEKKAVEVELVDCQTLVDQLLIDIDAEIKSKDACISYNCLPVIYSNKLLVKVIFEHLITNALKFSYPKRRLEISINAENCESFWLFSVADNGIGIDPDYKDKVFVPFQRIHRKDVYPGTGIGLSICEKFINYYGGSIWFESEPGIGTTFYFNMPKKLKDMVDESVKSAGNITN
ncbi:sensor histidine kinase [Spartinivicinus poritis]|uniref:histidine kinase n=1 Tax=Spartinivicinus poritis TaxID=2994640 RepID=A0ABT5U8Q4_9GAMM|nr:ATP-binding protein [Spartinivicinus sp. A2-2]MDE1462754.1 ATP-binding protein [Spartinivicinus sp. A2-2]